MNDLLRFSLCAAAMILFFGCADPKKSGGSAGVNPMNAIWASIGADIDRLERDQAPRAQWEKASGESSRVADLPQLHSRVARLKLKPAELRQLDRLFVISPQVIHFGFEGDYHALVFFDSGDLPKHVVKW